MFANSLTREVSLKVGPVILEVLVKHYFDRLKGDAEKEGLEGSLKQDDVLYHEAFTIVKAFLNASTFHTIEELQAFSNTRTPSPPWTHVVRVLVPISCCEEASPYLIKALGGEEVARRLVGGVKWWQVRGVNGVDSQWLTSKKDWQDAKRKHKKQQQRKKDGIASPPLVGDDGLPSAASTDGGFPGPSSEGDDKDKTDGVYEKNMDAMRCILYLHGGGYYFGSVDQERYSIQRFARKINGRVFAINYRLAPQYPFPCGLQDALAAYLFLIRPPMGSAHQAVDPAHIIISGDSAGGGLSLALLQVIRDSGLPAPAGGVLISPWCDLTHSFPSVHINTATDIVPDSGLSFHKPSLLWPPPSEEISNRVQASLRFRIRQAFKSEEPSRLAQDSTFSELQGDASGALLTPIPSSIPVDPEKVVLNTTSGEMIEVHQQLQFYARNSMLAHPLISPAMAYLGGLPPLLFIAGDKEVLRDEIIYTAHKAAYPEKYPITHRARELYPLLNGIEDKYRPTSVHLQVYDDSPHILPVLFSFTTPAKFCFRAIANFSKLVTGLTPIPAPSIDDEASTATPPPVMRRQSLFAGFKTMPRRHEKEQHVPALLVNGTAFTDPPEEMGQKRLETGSKPSIKRSLSARLSRAGSILRRQTSASPVLVSTSESTVEAHVESAVPSSTTQKGSVASSDVGGHRFQTSPSASIAPAAERAAGDISVYRDIKDVYFWKCRMIRERVSTAGVTRALELENELDAIQLAPERIGVFGEATTHRYLKQRALFEKKFEKAFKAVEKQRRQSIERAKTDTIKRLGVLRQLIRRDGTAVANGNKKVLRENVMSSPGWGWAWALDEGEDPPPSSIVSRRDTEEARKLAEIADQAVLSEDQTFSGNNLWAVVINFLTATPGRHTHTLYKYSEESSEATSSDAGPSTSGEKPKLRKPKSKLSLFHLWKRSGSNERHEE